jgi:hypothetical protein
MLLIPKAIPLSDACRRPAKKFQSIVSIHSINLPFGLTPVRLPGKASATT